MARTKASATASISSHTRSHRVQREDPKSRTEIEAKEVAAAPVGGPGPEGLVIEGSSATESDDDDLSTTASIFASIRPIVESSTTTSAGRSGERTRGGGLRCARSTYSGGTKGPGLD
jgi:hypothetical protein